MPISIDGELHFIKGFRAKVSEKTLSIIKTLDKWVCCDYNFVKNDHTWTTPRRALEQTKELTCWMMELKKHHNWNVEMLFVN